MDKKQFDIKMEEIERRMHALYEERRTLLMEMAAYEKKNGTAADAIEKDWTPIDTLPITPDTVVVYQGVQGAFSEQATVSYFGRDVRRKHVDEFDDILVALENGEADYGVLPVENSSAGFVSGSYDLLLDHDAKIVAEKVLRVEQSLLALPGASLSDIKTVFSHPQALMQSADYLAQYDWEQIAYANTAMAAQKIKEDGIRSQAAIASTMAAELYGLHVLVPSINYSQTNATRFFILTRGKNYVKSAKNITICFSLPHKSGTLYNILGHVIYYNINMTSIESSPMKETPWEYNFFISFEGNLRDIPVRNAMDAIRKEALQFKILGSY